VLQDPLVIDKAVEIVGDPAAPSTVVVVGSITVKETGTSSTLNPREREI
jgi:hypothetical protein